MSNLARLRVTDTILAFLPVPPNPDFVEIPIGAVIETTDNFSKRGLHPVTYDGETLLVFTRDIRERTQRASVASVVWSASTRRGS